MDTSFIRVPTLPSHGSCLLLSRPWKIVFWILAKPANCILVSRTTWGDVTGQNVLAQQVSGTLRDSRGRQTLTHRTLDEGHGLQHSPDHWGSQIQPTQGSAISNNQIQGRPPAAPVIMLRLRFQRVNTVGITQPLWESRIQTALIVSAFVTLSCAISVDLSLCPTWIRYI
ncbi:hypothetical protein HOY82DRAFT_559966 [Tuber indicum]|nr:hypothetical protein HOY82DRAFT_559966 [Tuber indicum]